MDTLEEIKQILKENALAMAELRKSQEETTAMFKETDAKFKETEAQMARTDAQIAKSEARLAKSETKWERMSSRLGSMSENQGYTTEDYFYNSLLDIMQLGTIKFDDISKNIHVKSKRLEDEFDIVMYNGNSIALIECKYKAHKKDVEYLIDKKISNFRLSHPDYADYKIYLGIASFAFYDELEENAKENGVAILKQKGEVVEIDDKNLKVY